MEELVKLLRRFKLTLELQSNLLQELVPILDREEELIMRFEVREFESLVVEKDQIVKRAKSAEHLRQQLLQRICFLIGFDARGELPTLRSFLEVFQSYLTRVKDLVGAQIHGDLCLEHSELSILAKGYLETFQNLAPRIGRNKSVLARTSKNFARSLTLLRQDASMQEGYTPEGRASSGLLSPDVFSSVRVKA